MIIVFKKLYQFFGSLLTILIITLILIFSGLIALFIFTGKVIVGGLANFPSVIYFLMFVASIYFLITGMFEFISVKRKGGGENRLVKPKRKVLRGIAGMVVLLLLYFLISAVASLLGTDVQGGRGLETIRITEMKAMVFGHRSLLDSVP